MKQTDFTESKIRKRILSRRRYLIRALQIELYPLLVRRFYKKMKFVRNDLKRIKIRKQYISTTYFNINIYSEEQSFKNFRFRTSDIGTISDIMGFTVVNTLCRNFFCNYKTDTFIVLCRLVAPFKWSFYSKSLELDTTNYLRRSGSRWKLLQIPIPLIENFRRDPRTERT